jgi:methyltransferase (TIGR00027 family)
MDPVVLTSRWMAAARARESERPDRLFNDPLAAALAGPEGFAWLDRMEPAARLGGPGLYAVVRTRFFDDFLLHASQRTGARQLIILAAGMDARAFRMEWLPGTRLYELDRPEVLATKDAVIARAGAHPTCERRAIAADLERPSWSAALLDAGYEVREPSVWLAEGVFFYMTEAAVGVATPPAAGPEPRELWHGALPQAGCGSLRQSTAGREQHRPAWTPSPPSPASRMRSGS